MAVLPLQQQTAMKKMMETRIPHIDALVAQAGRQEWISQQSQQQQFHNSAVDRSPDRTDGVDEASKGEDDGDLYASGDFSSHGYVIVSYWYHNSCHSHHFSLFFVNFL